MVTKIPNLIPAIHPQGVKGLKAVMCPDADAFPFANISKAAKSVMERECDVDTAVDQLYQRLLARKTDLPGKDTKTLLDRVIRYSVLIDHLTTTALKSKQEDSPHGLLKPVHDIQHRSVRDIASRADYTPLQGFEPTYSFASAFEDPMMTLHNSMMTTLLRSFSMEFLRLQAEDSDFDWLKTTCGAILVDAEWGRLVHGVFVACGVMYFYYHNIPTVVRHAGYKRSPSELAQIARNSSPTITSEAMMHAKDFFRVDRDVSTCLRFETGPPERIVLDPTSLDRSMIKTEVAEGTNPVRTGCPAHVLFAGIDSAIQRLWSDHCNYLETVYAIDA